MEYATRAGVELAYDVRGPPDAKPVVFVEGLAYGRWMWRFQREGLPSYRTIVFDNRGTGESDVPEGPYTIAEMAGDLQAVLADLGVRSAHVVGASLGGMIALEHALEYDDTRSLTLLCTSPGGEKAPPMPEATREQIFEVPDHLDERAAIRHKMAPALSDGFVASNEGLIERIVDWRLESDAPERAREWQAAAVADFDASDGLGDVDVPALVMAGTDDRVLPYENAELLAEGLPNAELVPVAAGSHLFFIEQPEAVNRRIREFLDHV